MWPYSSNRQQRPLTAQVGVFVLGAFGWLALTRGLYASALVCGLGAITLAWLGLSHSAFVLGRDLLKRTQPGATFTSELSRRRLQVLLDQTPSPLLLQPDNGQLIAVNRAARNLFDVSYALPVSARKALLGEAATPAGLSTIGSQIKWKGQTYAVHLAEMEEVDHLPVREGALEGGGDLFLVEFEIDDDRALRRHAGSCCYWLIVSLRTASRLKAAAIRALV